MHRDAHFAHLFNQSVGCHAGWLPATAWQLLHIKIGAKFKLGRAEVASRNLPGEWGAKLLLQTVTSRSHLSRHLDKTFSRHNKLPGSQNIKSTDLLSGLYHCYLSVRAIWTLHDVRTSEKHVAALRGSQDWAVSWKKCGKTCSRSRAWENFSDVASVIWVMTSTWSLFIEGRSSTRGCRSSRGIIDFSVISLRNFTKLTGFNLDRCPNLSVKGHQNRTSLWLFFPAPTTTPTPTTTATPLYVNDVTLSMLGNQSLSWKWQQSWTSKTQTFN